MIQFGIDRILSRPPVWKEKKIGLVTNQAATTRDGGSVREVLLRQGFGIIKLFSPEHGLDVKGADGHRMQDGIDVVTGLPVISLYSTKLAPDETDLADLDLVVFDIPDVGSRFYTYLWTMTYVMEACARNRKPLYILDRPNPVSGNPELAEGPILDESQASFIGRWAIPIRHSCTLGELAVYFNQQQQIGCDLQVITCEGWRRNEFQPDWGIRFVPTSPAIQSFQSMLLYPGLCLLEATNISEGRGTGYSFCAAGAPWIDSQELAGVLFAMGLDDLEITPIQYTPEDKNCKYDRQPCNGILLEVREPRFFQSVSFGLLLIKLIKQMYPGHFAWKPYPTLVNPSGEHHLDKLLGIPGSEQLFELSMPQFLAAIARITQCREWTTQISGHLLYS